MGGRLIRPTLELTVFCVVVTGRPTAAVALPLTGLVLGAAGGTAIASLDSCTGKSATASLLRPLSTVAGNIGLVSTVDSTGVGSVSADDLVLSTTGNSYSCD